MHRVIRRLRDLREQHYALLRGFFHGASDAGAHLSDAEQPRLHAVTLDGDAWAVGRSLDEVALAKVGAGATAIRRRSQPKVALAGDTRLQAGDVVVLQGGATAVAAGEARLLGG